jgi:signal transduction histidine kinase
VICGAEMLLREVKDEGIGIPLENRVRLFEQIHRASNGGYLRDGMGGW